MLHLRTHDACFAQRLFRLYVSRIFLNLNQTKKGNKKTDRRMNCPKLYGQHKNSLNGRKY